MSLVRRPDGSAEYKLEGCSTEPSRAIGGASNRQKKLLRFFGVPFGRNISFGAAGWEIETVMSNDESRQRWRKYLFLTSDFDIETDQLKPFDAAALEAVQIPEGWSSSDAMRHFREELAAEIIHDGSPFDVPPPAVVFSGKTFMFTGAFAFGSRTACRDAVQSRGGSAPDQKWVSHLVDYLVIGTKGSTRWKRDGYGNKIEEALLARREHGSPAIISEDQWALALKAT